MGSVRWRKVARDLVRFRARTILVVASIAMGVFAVGTIAGGQALLDQSLRDGYALAKGSNAILYTANPFDRTLVEVIRDLPGVGVAEGRRTVSVRVKTGDTWRQLQLTAIPDYRHQDIDVVLPERGDFPPKRGEVLFERSATTIADLVIGGDAVIELPGGKEKQLKIAGFAHEPGASPAYYFGRLSAYVTFDTLEDLGFDRSFQEIRIRAANPSISQKKAQTLADQVRFRMEKAGPAITFALIPTPGKHPAQELLDAIFIVLAGLGFLSLLVSGFLVANTVAVIMTQQTRQIGVMKAVGAGTGDIAALYLVLVGAYATLALLIAIPLAALAGYALAVFVTGLVNLDVQRVFVPVEAIELEILVGLVVPLLAAVVPVIRGTRVTVHQALRYTGVAETYGHGRIDRIVQAIRGLPRPMLLAVRNTFRRKGRLTLTLAALALGGAVFMTVFTVRDGLLTTMQDTFEYFNYDVQLDLTTPTRASAVTSQALSVPGAKYAEGWQYATALRVRPDGSESGALASFGLPADTQTVRPIVERGRWLLPGEGNALVVTANLLREEPDLKLGDTVRLKIRDRSSEWTLVGIVQSPTMEPFLYMSSDRLGAVTGTEGRAGVVVVTADPTAGISQADFATALRNKLETSGIAVSGTTTSGNIAGTISTLFDTLVLVVTVMAVLLGVVGGLGLAGTMTMNVVERSREIGVLRAVGATDLAVLQIFLTEGAGGGVLAWAVGAVIAVPISYLLSNAIGDAFVQRPLPSQPSLPGMALWLGVVLVLSTLGSLLPAWRASRISVREVLAYE